MCLSSRSFLHRGHQGADADLHRAQVADVVDFQLGIQLAAVFQDGAHLVAGDGVGAAAEAHQLHQLHIRLFTNVPGGVVHPGVVGPLVEDVPGGPVLQVSDGVLGDQDEAVGGNQVVDAVVDLRVDVVGTARQHDNGQALGPRLINVLLARAVNVLLIAVIGLVCRPDGVSGLPPGHAEGVGKPLGADALVVLGTVQAGIGVEEPGFLQVGHIRRQQLGVIGHHRAVVVVVRRFFVKIVGHAGVENGVHPRLHQGFHMAVKQLGGVAHRVGGDGALALDVQLPGGLGGEHHLEIQPGEQLEPEGEILVHIQPERDADAPPGTVPGTLTLHSSEFFIFVAVQVGQLHIFLSQGTGAAISGDEPPSVVKGVDGERTVIGAQIAGGGLCGVSE